MSWKLLGLVGMLGGAGCMDINLDMGPGEQGSGNMATETRNVEAFNQIDTRGAYEVDVNVGPAQHVEISGDDNLLKLVQTSVKDGKLILTTKKNLRPKKRLKVTISVPHLQSFSLEGAGNVTIDGVHEDSFSASLSGAGNMKASGQAKEVDLALSGAGNLNCFDLRGEDTHVDLSGAGNADVYASKSLEANMSGVGNLSYKGHPATVDKNKRGVGSIRAAD